MNSEKIFKPLNIFSYRTPLLPINVFLENLSSINNFEDLLLLYFSYPIIQEALLIANPQLYRLIQNISKLDEHKRDKVFKSLLSYLIRLTTRPTPFGLFSSIGVGQFSSSTDLVIKPYHQLIKQIRPDMEWYYKMIESIEKTRQFFDILKVKVEEMLYISGGRIYNPRHWDKKNEEYNEVSIKCTPLTSFILEYTKDWVEYSKLKKAVSEEFFYIDNIQLDKALNQLFQKQYIISELAPNLLSKNPVELFLEKLSKIRKESGKDIEALRKEIYDYNHGISQNNFFSIDKIRNSLSGLLLEVDKSSQKNYIQLDSAHEGDRQFLAKKVGNEATKVAELLYEIACSKQDKSQIDQYHTLFLEKYGTETFVPFLELIDEHKGLGLPNLYEDNEFKAPNDWEKRILNKCHQAIFRKEKEVVIDLEDINYLKSRNFSKKFPPTSGALFCEVLAKSQGSIDNGDFKLALSSGHIYNNATGTLGRFTHVLPTKVVDEIQKIHEEESQLEQRAILVELSWLPHLGKLSNVAIHPNFRNYFFSIPNTKCDHKESFIPLNDLYVGADNETLILFSKKNDMRVIFVSNNALNERLAPLAIQFLHQVSQSTNLQIGNFYVQSSHLPYLPRVRYSKTYLLPATWVIALSYFSTKKPSKKSDLKIKLNKWMDEWNVPKYVYVNRHYTDQALLLNRENPVHLNQIIHVLEKDGSISLSERLEIEDSKWVKGQLGPYICELVIPFVRTQIRKFYSIQRGYKEQSMISARGLGSPWLFLKLEAAFDRQNDILINHILPTMSKLDSQNWFYVRYKEKRDHIRLRIKSDPKIILNKILPVIHQWASVLMSDGYISDISYHTYHPEIDRYGGKGLIERAEAIFGADSLTAISILFEQANADIPIIAIGSLSIIQLILSFNLTLEQAASCLELSSTEGKDISGFRKIKPWLLNAVSMLVNLNQNSIVVEKFLISCDYRKNEIQKYRKLGEYLFDPLTDQTRSILDSFTHMHLNRLGILPHDELKVRFFAYKTIKTLLKMKTAKFSLSVNN